MIFYSWDDGNELTGKSNVIWNCNGISRTLSISSRINLPVHLRIRQTLKRGKNMGTTEISFHIRNISGSCTYKSTYVLPHFTRSFSTYDLKALAFFSFSFVSARYNFEWTSTLKRRSDHIAKRRRSPPGPEGQVHRRIERQFAVG